MLKKLPSSSMFKNFKAGLLKNVVECFRVHRIFQIVREHCRIFKKKKWSQVYSYIVECMQMFWNVQEPLRLAAKVATATIQDDCDAFVRK